MNGQSKNENSIVYPTGDDGELQPGAIDEMEETMRREARGVVESQSIEQILFRLPLFRELLEKWNVFHYANDNEMDLLINQVITYYRQIVPHQNVTGGERYSDNASGLKRDLDQIRNRLKSLKKQSSNSPEQFGPKPNNLREQLKILLQGI